MGKTIAIDLGTTNSVIAVLGVYPDAGLVVNDEVTVIQDDNGNTTVPSVVACNALSDGETASFEERVIVGHLAKQRAARALEAGESPPVSFVKRFMGTNRTFRVGERDLLPEQVSGHILHELIKRAEARLGDTVETVLITVPAYFKIHQKQLTREAGEKYANELRALEQERTGIPMPPVKVMEPLLEPVAAAHAYCMADDREELTLLVYDLGGGTFDATVLSKHGDTFDVVRRDGLAATGGDPLLGGYNFDKAIADRLLGELRKRYELGELDEEDPGDRSIINKLMHMAEEAKLQVSTGSRTQTEINENAMFNDKSRSEDCPEGRPVNVQNRAFSRRELNELIAHHVDDTVKECKRVLSNVKLSIDQIDEVVLVGGSSQIELVRERFLEPPGLPEEEMPDGNAGPTDSGGGFGKEPKLFKPHLAVAVGAAYFAVSAQQSQLDGMTLAPVPPDTFQDEILLEGSVETDGAVRIRVLRQDGAEFDCEIADDGAFSLDVELIPDVRNVLRLILEDANGNALSENEISVVQSDTDTTPVPPVNTVFLSRDIQLRLHSRVHLLAPEGTPLPFEEAFDQGFRTAGEGIGISIPLLEDMHTIADLGISELGVRVPAHHPIDLRITIDPSGDIRGLASITLDGREYSEESSAKFAPREARDKKALRQALNELEERYSSEVEISQDPDIRMNFGSPIRDYLDSCARELDAETLDPLRAEDALLQVNALFERLRRTQLWLPTYKSLLGDAESTRVLAAQIESVMDSPELASAIASELEQLDAIVDLAKAAYAEKDKRKWVQCSEDLDSVKARIINLFPPESQSPEQLKRGLLQQISMDRAKAEQSQQRDAVNSALDEAEREIGQVDTSLGDAESKLIQIREQLLQPVWRHLDKGKRLPENLKYTEAELTRRFD